MSIYVVAAGMIRKNSKINILKMKQFKNLQFNLQFLQNHFYMQKTQI